MRSQVTTSLALLATLWQPALLLAANPRSYIEAVRRAAPVVYLGEVEDVTLLESPGPGLRAAAEIKLSAVARSPSGAAPERATIRYGTWDDEHPPLAGGPQYRLQPGTTVLVFADGFEAPVPPGYLVHGKPQEVLDQVETLRRVLAEMSDDQLARNEITTADRKVQLALYERLLELLGELE